MAQHINIKLTEEEENFLKKIALDNQFYKKSGELSEGKALKYLISKAINSDEELVENEEDNSHKNIEKMLEQVCITLPHILQSSYISAQSSLSQLSTEKGQTIRNNSLAYLAVTCGQIQDLDCKNNYVSYNDRAMKTIPIDEDKNKWK
ncbi:hypothetical protein Psal006b_03568 (plasmid) [Piscirickettsia salmonis]|uniref:Phosphonate ABC transporter ATP-binding protein n=1 Tax=Piscirickettsia salmonis TaxID=1238 RepID=A0A1L6TI91_PISSA|nr:hypothetical protein [Piscirickettsia salmonis]ALB24394.1 phosphonate ABC transporter ATP-binding protein [Piscirickettsia salmonis]ALT18976.1 hypothetical protein PSLF89_09080 [Piscirickettsia salmonis LF-89 = ATCC VR-1361]AMA44052.1 hypothetical protein AWJ11_16870 [Piscirickettsia salmonis]AOS36842.1 hypothetical protein AVM72_15810 [Piscirickettsia salmonis]APS62292.1 hypothetical protein AVI53_17210 [Piscirickettsia salmonis]